MIPIDFINYYENYKKYSVMVKSCLSVNFTILEISRDIHTVLFKKNCVFFHIELIYLNLTIICKNKKSFIDSYKNEQM